MRERSSCRAPGRAAGTRSGRATVGVGLRTRDGARGSSRAVGGLPRRSVGRDLALPLRVVPLELGLGDGANASFVIEPAVREQEAEPNATKEEIGQRHDAFAARRVSE